MELTDTDINDKRCFIDTKYDDRAGVFVSFCQVIAMAPDGQKESHDRPILAYAPERDESIQLCLTTVRRRNPDNIIVSSAINGL